MEKLFNFRPICFALFSFLTGIAIFYFALKFGFVAVVVSIVSILTICFAVCIKLFSKKTIFYSIFSIVLIVLALTICFSKLNNLKKAQNGFNENQNYFISGKIISANALDGNLNVYSLENVKIDGKKVSFNITLYDYGVLVENLNEISFESKLSKNCELDFTSLYKNVGFIANSYGSLEAKRSKSNIFEAGYFKIKDVIFDSYGENAPFVMALILGDTDYVEKGEISNFRYSGVAHIFAVSGLHVGFIVALFSFLFNLLNIKRFKNAILTGLIAFTYCGICGFSPSAIRALIMSITLLFMSSLGRKYDLLESISLSMILVSLINPFVISQVGFVLSYACVFSICLFEPTLRQAIHFGNNKLQKAFCLSLAVMIGVLPLSSYYFGYVSVISLFLNLLIIPIVSILYYLIVLTIIITLIIGKFTAVVFISQVLITFVRNVFSIIAFDKLILKIELSIIPLAIYYSLILLASEKINLNKKLKLFAFSCSLLVLAIFCI